MGFENPKLQNPLCTCGNPIGYGFYDPATRVCNKSSCPDWSREPRDGSSLGHIGTDWTFLWVEKNLDRKQHQFELRDIIVAPGSSPVQVWWTLANGETWGFDNLGPGWHWLGSQTTAVSAWIGTASGHQSGGPARIIDFEIRGTN